ncbi:PIG-L deacetylase family protein, partial [Klebsiella pneumoniae]
GWGDSGSWSQSSGSIYVDISKHLERKISILGKHESQMSNVENSLISLDAVRRLASFRGLESGVNYAELFYLLRSKITY